jgi:hypothetical protein
MATKLRSSTHCEESIVSAGVSIILLAESLSSLQKIPPNCPPSNPLLRARPHYKNEYL